jgi:cell division protein ZapE
MSDTLKLPEPEPSEDPDERTGDGAATGVAGRYDADVAAGRLRYDTAQHAIAVRLDRLAAELAAAVPEVKSSALGWLFGRRAERRAVAGLYIHGAVGRGKTMLMDLFHDVAPVAQKRRVHFHAFMAEIQDALHAARQAIVAGRIKGDDPIAPVATAVADRTRLLCFDEFAVTDIADAMILGRLFTALFARGVVVVATSNVAPADLYRGGLNRALFLPFIDLIARHMDIMALEARTDYRRLMPGGERAWITPAGPAATAALDHVFAGLTDGAPARPESVPFRGRRIEVPRAAAGVARFGFADLCARPLAAADYLALAGLYHTILVDDVPVLDERRRNEARRFIHLVDALYDRGIRLVASAAAPPDGIYRAETGQEAFEFARTASRLTEMASVEYLARRQDDP